MSRTPVFVAIALAAASVAWAAQTEQPKTKEPKPLTLVGCVSNDESNQVTFADAKDGTIYKLSGTDATSYIGKRVQIVGATDSKRVKVRTGLGPSPNVAAQAGAMDPAQAAIAAQSAMTRGTGTGELPEFRVKAVKQVKGNCPQPGK